MCPHMARAYLMFIEDYRSAVVETVFSRLSVYRIIAKGVYNPYPCLLKKKGSFLGDIYRPRLR